MLFYYFLNKIVPIPWPRMIKSLLYFLVNIANSNQPSDYRIKVCCMKIAKVDLLIGALLYHFNTQRNLSDSRCRFSEASTANVGSMVWLLR